MMKPSNKMWLNQHSAHDYPALITRWKDLANKVGLEIVSLCQQGGYETIALQGEGEGKEDGLYLSAGVHGDEPAAVWALLEWAEANQKMLKRETVIILPCVNPWGFTNNVRMDFRRRDLNRLFHNKTLPFFRRWGKLLGSRRFRLALNLHEDYDAQGIYVYELGPRGGGDFGSGFRADRIRHPEGEPIRHRWPANKWGDNPPQWGYAAGGGGTIGRWLAGGGLSLPISHQGSPDL